LCINIILAENNLEKAAFLRNEFKDMPQIKIFIGDFTALRRAPGVDAVFLLSLLAGGRYYS